MPIFYEPEVHYIVH